MQLFWILTRSIIYISCKAITNHFFSRKWCFRSLMVTSLTIFNRKAKYLNFFCISNFNYFTLVNFLNVQRDAQTRAVIYYTIAALSKGHFSDEKGVKEINEKRCPFFKKISKDSQKWLDTKNEWKAIILEKIFYFF